MSQGEGGAISLNNEYIDLKLVNNTIEDTLSYESFGGVLSITNARSVVIQGNSFSSLSSNSSGGLLYASSSKI